MTTLLEIQRYRGDTVEDEINITLGGAVYDITGHSFILTVNTELDPVDDTTQVFQVTGTLSDVANGIVKFFPTATDVDQEPGLYFYDIEMVLPSGKVKTLGKNTYTFLQDITKVN